jgi:hypothetical protein
VNGYDALIVDDHRSLAVAVGAGACADVITRQGDQRCRHSLLTDTMSPC